MKLSKQEIHKFLSYVDERGEDECWPWTGGKSSRGYGVFNVPKNSPRRTRQATHLAVFIARGDVVPSGRYVLHSCDNPQCVNPKHLRVGTPTANSADAKERKRASPPPVVRDNPEWERKRLAAMPRGEANKASIYCEADVRSICELRRSGLGPRPIAQRLGLRETFVQDVIYRRAWKHVSALLL